MSMGLLRLKLEQGLESITAALVDIPKEKHSCKIPSIGHMQDSPLSEKI
jgi:hypothetical protein